jgi:hypothetical protein
MTTKLQKNFLNILKNIQPTNKYISGRIEKPFLSPYDACKQMLKLMNLDKINKEYKYSIKFSFIDHRWYIDYSIRNINYKK